MRLGNYIVFDGKKKVKCNCKHDIVLHIKNELNTQKLNAWTFRKMEHIEGKRWRVLRDLCITTEKDLHEMIQCDDTIVFHVTNKENGDVRVFRIKGIRKKDSTERIVDLYNSIRKKQQWN